MTKRRQATAFGWEVKRKLAELEMDQRSFCKKYDIPEARLSELITGKRPVTRYRELIEHVLDIDPTIDAEELIDKS